MTKACPERGALAGVWAITGLKKKQKARGESSEPGLERRTAWRERRTAWGEKDGRQKETAADLWTDSDSDSETARRQ